MVVLIAGMHRSGTSMIARLLNLCGVYLGEEKDLIPAAEDNPEGFWENAKFQAISDEILAVFGGSWDLPPNLVDGWEESSRLLPIRERARELISEFSQYQIWGWKDPRGSLTLPFWKSLIPDLKIVICLRNPYDVFHSLTRRGYASSAFSYDLWLKYYQQLLVATDPSVSLITHFESYFLDSQSEVRRVINYLGVDASDKIIADACKTISADLRHSHGNKANLIETGASIELLRMYSDLCYQSGEVYRASLTDEEYELLGNVKSFNVSTSNDIEKLLIKYKIEVQDRKRLVQQNDWQNKILTRQSKMLNQQNEEIMSLHKVLESRSWKLMTRFQKLRETFIPLGSKREKIAAFFLHGLRKLLKIFYIFYREGFRSLLARAFNRVEDIPPIKSTPDAVLDVFSNLLLTANGHAKDDFVPLAKENISINQDLIKLIAFYLPQFHPIPENDKWWGKGFTEWQNVSKAVPQFSGHYQPHLPGDLGFYDLRLPQVQSQQIELARKYGIYGFAFYYYWFNGKRLLEKPLDMFLQSKEDFPFCICWANENWTRRWDGQEDEVLIGQEHSPESDLRFIEDIGPLLKDKRYIRINGRPLLIVYRANILPDVLKTVSLWREYCKNNDIGDPYLVAAQTFLFKDPREVGFDAAVEFPPHNVDIKNITRSLKISNPNYKGAVVDYKDMVQKESENMVTSEYKLFKTVFPSWDNEARKPGRGFTFAFSTPDLYRRWLLKAARFTLQESNPDKRLLFINAWNEWAEGAHLEPDRRYGYAYLQSTADALKEIESIKIVTPEPVDAQRNQSDRQARIVETDHRLSVPIVIFQSGKVGSMSLLASLEKKYKEIGIDTPVYHAHILENIDQRIEFVTQSRVNPANTIKKLMESKEIRDRMDSHPEKKWNIINLVRDPVALKVSALFQLIDEYFPDWQKRFETGDLSLADMQRTLLEKQEFQPDHLDDWFDNQLKPVCRIDIFTVPFSKENGYQIYQSNPRINLMIIRLEDLEIVAEKSFREFIGFDDFSITRTNIGDEKPYHKIYEQFKKTPLPVDYLDRAYKTRYAQYFYTEQEIESFRNHWLFPNSRGGE